MKLAELLEERNQAFIHDGMNYATIKKYEKIISDIAYFDFIRKSKNGGFFYGKSLHLYGYSDNPDFHNAELINQILTEQFKDIVSGLFSFGQDIFGHQFAFDASRNKIVFFNIETGGKEIIANDFSDWIDLLLDETGYFTGKGLAEGWEEKNTLRFDQRLCPKIPFVLGGDYVLSNLYASNYPDFLISNANIANQTYGLPDGAKFKITIKNTK